MGRAARRKRDRRDDRPTVGVIVSNPESTFILTDAAPGLVFAPDVHELQGKVKGQHRFVVFVGYRVSEEAALAAFENTEKVIMDMENIISFGVGCWDCETEFQECVGKVCPGEGRDL